MDFPKVFGYDRPHSIGITDFRETNKLLLLFRIARRNILRHLRRSTISIASVGFGLAVILWLQAILAGSNQNVVDTITSTDSGDFQVFRQDYIADRSIGQSFEPDAWLDAAELEKQGLTYAARVNLPALASSGEQSLPILLRGIDPDREPRITRLREALVEGEFLSAGDERDCGTRAAYVSRALAQTLRIKLGQKFVILAQANDGTLGNELLRIKGMFDTGSPDYDKGIVFAPRACVAAIGGLSGVHEMAFKTVDRKIASEPALRSLRARLPQSLVAQSWREVEPRLAAIEKFNDASLLLVSAMLFVVISLGILNSFLISVFERTVEFGVMMALGSSPKFVVALVMLEGALLGLAASALGAIAGALAIGYHAWRGFDLQVLVGQNLSVGTFKLNLIIYPIVSLVGALRATAFTLVVVLISVLYPAIRAARLRPLAAIRGA